MTPSKRIKKADDVRYRILDGEAIVVRQRAAEVLGLDAAGSRILELLDQKRPLDDIVAVLVEEYEGDRDIIANEVESFVRDLIEAGVLELVAEGD